jgi:hypothetical protein
VYDDGMMTEIEKDLWTVLEQWEKNPYYDHDQILDVVRRMLEAIAKGEKIAR